jgi:hypothetical protein
MRGQLGQRGGGAAAWRWPRSCCANAKGAAAAEMAAAVAAAEVEVFEVAALGSVADLLEQDFRPRDIKSGCMCIS